MRIFSSPNPDFKEIAGLPSEETNYIHPLTGRKNHPIPVAFQVTSPFNRLRVLLPHTLVMHVNPTSLQETHTQKVERFQTRGGWQEQHWGQDLTEVSADASTGAFMNIYTGLSSVVRQRTIAWDRYRDLHDLYLHNGSVYDPFGNIVLQGYVMLLYDRGTYLGTFRSFEVEETADSPFAFKITWSFKIEHTISSVHFSISDAAANLRGRPAPAFQSQNAPVVTGATDEQREANLAAARVRRGEEPPGGVHDTTIAPTYSGETDPAKINQAYEEKTMTDLERANAAEARRREAMGPRDTTISPRYEGTTPFNPEGI